MDGRGQDDDHPRVAGHEHGDDHPGVAGQDVP